MKPLNDDELKAAALRYCELEGTDPMGMVSHGTDPEDYPDGRIPAVLYQSPRWTRVVRYLRGQDRVAVALFHGRWLVRETGTEGGRGDGQ